MIYPQKLNHKKTNFMFQITTLISFLIALTLTIINNITSPKIPWAALSNAGIVYIWITVIYSLNRNTNIAGYVLIQCIAISLLTAYIDYCLGFKTWSLSLAIPIIIIVANVTMFVLTIISHKQFIQYAIYQLIICFISMIPIIFMINHMIENLILSIIATSISGINLLVSICLCAGDVKKAIIRNFHL